MSRNFTKTKRTDFIKGKIIFHFHNKKCEKLSIDDIDNLISLYEKNTAFLKKTKDKYLKEDKIENKQKINKKLKFLSRHAPNDGQIALAKAMGYDGIAQEPIIFRKDPVEDLVAGGITEKEIAIVAPGYISNLLLNAGYTLIEFVNSPIKREKMVLLLICSLYLKRFFSHLT